MAMKHNPVIVALDLESAEEAVRMATSLLDHVGGFKVGLGLLHGPGPGLVSAIADLGKPVFADAKLHDIPSQVGAAAARLGRWGARWVTAHVSGGKPMLQAAVDGLAEGSDGRAGILAVTVLTSLDEAGLAAVGIQATPGKLVSRMARAADDCGAEGVICSPRELKVIADVAPRLLRVTPGIRPQDAEKGDQVRVATPRLAVERGADRIVIGRPITRAGDPVAAAATIVASLPAVEHHEAAT
jgi:orotidine-5'-phosphate decarboxylase